MQERGDRVGLTVRRVAAGRRQVPGEDALRRFDAGLADADEVRRLAGLLEVTGEVPGDAEAGDGPQIGQRVGRERHALSVWAAARRSLRCWGAATQAAGGKPMMVAGRRRPWARDADRLGDDERLVGVGGEPCDACAARSLRGVQGLVGAGDDALKSVSLACATAMPTLVVIASG